MKKWKYPEPTSATDSTPVWQVWTEDEIRRLYYPHWIKQMWRVGKQDQISFENCLEDWITIHWASPEEDDEHLADK